MCGIFGFYLNRRLSDIDVKNGKKYLDLLSHRGPDNTGFFVQKDIGLFIGHKRLSIIDVTDKSNQPYSKLKGIEYLYAVSFLKDIIFTKSKCDISEKLFEQLKIK